MALTLVFLGRLVDAAGMGERQIAHVSTLAELLAALDPELLAHVTSDKVKIAVNGQIVTDRADCPLNDGDEIAFLPPVSGG